MPEPPPWAGLFLMKKKKEFLKNKFVEFQKKIDSARRESIASVDDYEKQLVDMNLQFIDLLDYFENIEENINENSLDFHAAQMLKNIRTAKKKILRILKSNKVEKINFPENKAIMQFSKIIDTIDESSLEDGYIVEIIRNGYLNKINNKVLRKAELITVKKLTEKN